MEATMRLGSSPKPRFARREAEPATETVEVAFERRAAAKPRVATA